MNLALPIRASACPSLFRLAPARDGFIARIKLPLGHVAPVQAQAIAATAERFGNGIIEITSRANLQVRGLEEGDGPAFAALLQRAGLGTDPMAEDVLNVFVAPTHGIDGLVDTGPLAHRLLDRLRNTPLYHKLSPKFSIGIDGGEASMPRAHPHDIWLRAVDAERFAVGLCSAPLETPAGVVKAAEVEMLVASLLDQVVAAGCGRMRELPHPDLTKLAPAPELPPPVPGAAPLGIAGAMAGGRPPLGRLDPQTFRALAELNGELRLTPWQSVLLVDIDDAETTRQRLDALGFVTDAEAPLAGLVACSGSSGCRSGRADTQGDALKLAARLGPAVGDIHVSGCEKGCAAARALPVTLIAVAPGRYDLYRRHESQGRNRFGRRIGAGLGLDEIADRLASGA